MSREITPLQPGDIAEVGQFLIAGFGAASDAEFASADVMTWKFFDPGDTSESPRAFVSRVDGRIVGFVGLCRRTFHVAGEPGREVSTLHMIDWFAERKQANAGAYLFLRVHRGAETAYTLGASKDARRVVAGAGYEELQSVPVFVKTVCPSYRLRAETGLRGMARAGIDLARGIRGRYKKPARPVTLERVTAFGAEVDTILDACEPGLVFTRRTPDLLNYMLRYPRKTISGYLIKRENDTLGFALLSVIPFRKTRVGKIVECFLPSRNRDDWHAAMIALTDELTALHADYVMVCGSTAWAVDALRSSGFGDRFRLEFRLRDKGNKLPHKLPFHLTWIEADYSYLQ